MISRHFDSTRNSKKKNNNKKKLKQKIESKQTQK